MAGNWTRIGQITGRVVSGSGNTARPSNAPGGGTGFQARLTLDTSDVATRLAAVGIILNPREMLEAIGFRWLRWVDENMREAGIDQPWPRMSPNTVFVRPTRTSDFHFSSRYLSRLRQSFVSNVTDTTVEVGTEQAFAEWHHSGTRPHDIFPVRAKRLRFMTTGGAVFAKKVRHPGTPPRALLPTKEVAERLAMEMLDAYARRAEEEFNRGNTTE